MNEPNDHTSNIVCRKAEDDHTKHIALSISQNCKFIHINVATMAGFLPHISAIRPQIIAPGIIPTKKAAVKIPV